MADVSRSKERPGAVRRAGRAIAETWRALDGDQRVAGIGAVLLIVSTFGPFSFVEGAILLIGAAILLLLRRRAQGRDFQLPFGDGTMIAAAGAWSAVLILLRLFSRPLGQGLLALVCAAILVVAGLRLRTTRARRGDGRAERRSRRERAAGARTEPRSAPREPRRRTEAPAHELFGAEPPAWTTPPSGNPSTGTPPAWRTDPGDEPDAPAAEPGDSGEPEAPEGGRSVPPATRVARAADDARKPPREP